MDTDDINEKERKSITEDMISVADKIAEIDLQNKKFLDKLVSKGLWTILGVMAILGAGIGIQSVFGSGELPQVTDNDGSEDNGKNE